MINDDDDGDPGRLSLFERLIAVAVTALILACAYAVAC